MSDMLHANYSVFDGQAVYRIDVQGRVPARWCERLEGMTVTEYAREAGPSVTTLLGELPDQAALAGILRTLYELHLSVLSVQRLSYG
jgi:hypothetical protein